MIRTRVCDGDGGGGMWRFVSSCVDKSRAMHAGRGVWGLRGRTCVAGEGLMRYSVATRD